MQKLIKKLILVLIIITSIILFCGCNKKVEEEKQMGNNENKIEYLGHGSLKILLKNGKVGYVDPYAGDDYKEKADFILVTHQHPDHNQLDLVTQNDGCIVYQNFDALVDGEYKKTNICGIDIESTEAYNKNHKKEECVGFILTIDGKKVYIAGDTSTTEQMKKLNEYNLDYAFLPMDGKFNMDIDEALQCEKYIKAKCTIPYHSSPGSLFDEERAKQFECDSAYILKPNEFLEIK